MMNVRKQIEEKINAGLISAHHACTDKISSIQHEFEERKRIRYDLYLQESRENNRSIFGLETELTLNSRQAQILIMKNDYEKAEKLIMRNKKIPYIIKVYKESNQKAVQKYTAAIADMQIETNMQLSYWKDIDMKLQDRIDYNSTYMVDYLYSMYNLTLGHDGFYKLWEPYRYKSKPTSKKDDEIFDNLFKWYMPKEQADYIFDELYKWDALNPTGIYSKYEDPDPYMTEANDRVFYRMVEELINSGGYLNGETLS